jgi:hypothetical protein
MWPLGANRDCVSARRKAHRGCIGKSSYVGAKVGHKRLVRDGKSKFVSRLLSQTETAFPRKCISPLNRRKSQSANFGTDSLRKAHRRTIGHRCTSSINLCEVSECGDDAALGLPVGWQRILAEPLGGQTDWLITLHDRLDDVGRKECEVDHLEDAALREVLRCGDLLEGLTLLERIKVLMRLGDVADQDFVDSSGLAAPDDQFGLDTALAELERDRE